MTARGKSKKLNKAWLHDHLTDPYVKLAQREGYRARAAYKLKEIDEQLHLLEPGQFVVDLGAVPGAWSQYVRRKFGRGSSTDPKAAPGPLHGTIVALDMLEFEPIDGVDFIAGDFREAAVEVGGGGAQLLVVGRLGADLGRAADVFLQRDATDALAAHLFEEVGIADRAGLRAGALELLEDGEKDQRDHQPDRDLRKPLIVHRDSNSKRTGRPEIQGSSTHGICGRF